MTGKWLAEVTYGDGTVTNSVVEALDEDEAWDMAAENLPAELPAPENLTVKAVE